MWSRLGDLMSCILNFNFWAQELNISGLKHARNMYESAVCSYSYLRHKHKLILSRLSDFVTFSICFNIQSEGFISKLWNIVGR